MGRLEVLRERLGGILPTDNVVWNKTPQELNEEGQNSTIRSAPKELRNLELAPIDIANLVCDKAHTRTGEAFNISITSKTPNDLEGNKRIADYVTRFMQDRGLSVEAVKSDYLPSAKLILNQNQKIGMEPVEGVHLTFIEKDVDHTILHRQHIDKFAQALADLSQVVSLVNDKQTGKWGRIA